MQLVKRLANNEQADSLAARLRRKRFGLFLSLIVSLTRPVRILDVGGTQLFWKTMGVTRPSDVSVVLLNLTPVATDLPGFESVTGDATSMPQYADGAFDVVFSNSVIEHVGDFAQQRRMADEVRRVGKRYFVQTPNRYFPIEPHFLFPFFQFLPVRLRLFLAFRFRLGWYGAVGDRAVVEEAVRSIRLLSAREVRRLFPGATIYRERFCGLTKSFVAYGGWERDCGDR